MNRPPAASRWRSVAGILLFCLFDAAASEPPPSSRPLTNEDIVRLVVNGTEERVILEEIATRSVDFDLEEEIVVELRLVGVNDRLIEAMSERQRELLRESDGEALPRGAVDPVATGLVVIALESGQDEDASAPFAIKALPDGVKRPPGMEVGRVSDLALAVLCATPDHVPDHWDIRSPIEEAPRHGLVYFQPGSRADKIKKFEVLRLTATTTPPIALRASRHRLIVALAGRSAGSGAWHLLASDPVAVDIEPGGTSTIRVAASSELRGNRMSGYSVEQEWKLATGVEERDE